MKSELNSLDIQFSEAFRHPNNNNSELIEEVSLALNSMRDAINKINEGY